MGCGHSSDTPELSSPDLKYRRKPLISTTLNFIPTDVSHLIYEYQRPRSIKLALGSNYFEQNPCHHICTNGTKILLLRPMYSVLFKVYDCENTGKYLMLTDCTTDHCSSLYGSTFHKGYFYFHYQKYDSRYPFSTISVYDCNTLKCVNRLNLQITSKCIPIKYKRGHIFQSLAVTDKHFFFSLRKCKLGASPQILIYNRKERKYVRYQYRDVQDVDCVNLFFSEATQTLIAAYKPSTFIGGHGVMTSYIAEYKMDGTCVRQLSMDYLLTGFAINWKGEYVISGFKFLHILHANGKPATEYEYNTSKNVDYNILSIACHDDSVYVLTRNQIDILRLKDIAVPLSKIDD